jgi:hypothetical protein
MNKRNLHNLIVKWQERADKLARINPDRSKGWIADQIVREETSKG